MQAKTKIDSIFPFARLGQFMSRKGQMKMKRRSKLLVLVLPILLLGVGLLDLLDPKNYLEQGDSEPIGIPLAGQEA